MKKALYLYNTASRSKELFIPVHDTVGIYCCGPTVYNYAHIGNLRTYLFEDILKRVLTAIGYPVKHVVNITDVGHLTSDEDTGDDKMEKGAAREGKSVWDIASYYTDRFKEDIRALNIIEPDLWPKATDHIDQMIHMISTLEENKFTYRTNDGIYFNTSKFPSYCEFARLDPESLRAGERVDMGEKRSVTDFALWKFSPIDKKRQMEWESPWGKGFPGWHIECSAMSIAYLPLPIDIHCGGTDHIRVHHTNEIAQTEAATGKKFVNYWLHGEFLVIDKEKMAKSGDNFMTLKVLQEKGFSPLAYRMFSYTAHYRNPLTFSWDGLTSSEHSLNNLRKAVPVGDQGKDMSVDVEKILKPFFEAICDDLNMPRAVAALWDILHDDRYSEIEKRNAAKIADNVLGLDLLKSKDNGFEYIDKTGQKSIVIRSQSQLSEDYKEGIYQKIRLRRDARMAKDFTGADRIRDELNSSGNTIKDMPDGTTLVTVENS